MLDASSNEKNITGRTSMSLPRDHDFPSASVNKVKLILGVWRLRITAKRRVKLN
jgi:hypothetical protein